MAGRSAEHSEDRSWQGSWVHSGQNVIPHHPLENYAFTIMFISIYSFVDPENAEKVRLSPHWGKLSLPEGG